MKKNAAVLIVDVQNDFCPGGALAVPNGDRVVEPLSRIAEYCAAEGLPVFASRDWHPPATRHFKEYGGVWPAHCIQDTSGAAFHHDLRLPEGTLVITKGNNPDSDAYSAFDGHDSEGRCLGDILKKLRVEHLYVGGLATDYCVCASALDARATGIAVSILTDAIAGVDVVAGDSEKALDVMKNAGISLVTEKEWLIPLPCKPEEKSCPAV
jgi:nicotinamidase/pyrazinamidase